MRTPKTIYQLDMVIAGKAAANMQLLKDSRRELYVNALSKSRRRMFEIVKEGRASTAYEVASIVGRTIHQASSQLRYLVTSGWLNRQDLLSDKGVREYTYTARKY